ncbi:MAG: class I SAM-dependent methyltransferase [Lachnospiraceae bacterium]|nr:class I SAM-dependent methyltransferase [Lachnospiraceae bacterium]
MKNVAGNHYDKYNSKNPIEKKLMKGFFDSVTSLFDIVKKDGDPSFILEAGCGEGVFTSFVRKNFRSSRIEAFDLEDVVVEKAIEAYKDLKIDFYTGSIYDTGKEDDSIPFVVCSEVLEHLEDPVKALRELTRIGSVYIFASVPHEPIWRILNMCRFKYLKDFGNTPGHINHFSKKGFMNLIKKAGGCEVIAYKRSLPWQMVLLRVDHTIKR